jgi:hypothetical protein
MDSPFDLALGPYRDTLPAAFKKQYLISVDSGCIAVFDGISDRIWHRPRWLWPLFWVLAHFNILFPETGTNIPATMKITGGRDRFGQPYHNWDRIFSFARPRYFNAVMAYDIRRQCVVEHFTSMNLLSMTWEISFYAPARLEIITSTCRLNLGALQIPLHRLFHPHVRVVESALDEDNIRVELVMSHPLLGDIFGYSGNYTVKILDATEI